MHVTSISMTSVCDLQHWNHSSNSHSELSIATVSMQEL